MSCMRAARRCHSHAGHIVMQLGTHARSQCMHAHPCQHVESGFPWPSKAHIQPSAVFMRMGCAPAPCTAISAAVLCRGSPSAARNARPLPASHPQGLRHTPQPARHTAPHNDGQTRPTATSKHCPATRVRANQIMLHTPTPPAERSPAMTSKQTSAHNAQRNSSRQPNKSQLNPTPPQETWHARCGS